MLHPRRRAAAAAQGVKPYKTTFYRAERFVEKPHFDKALEYVNSGHYRWNAGMFIWGFVTVTEGLQKHQPELYEACQRWFKARTTRRSSPSAGERISRIKKSPSTTR